MVAKAVAFMLKWLILLSVINGFSTCKPAFCKSTDLWCKQLFHCYSFEDVDSINYAGEIASFKGACEKKNEKWSLRLKWTEAPNLKNLLYYVVSFMIPDDPNGFCVCYNASKSTSFQFSESEFFKPNTDYLAQVRAYPQRPFQRTSFLPIKGCPRAGKVQWSSWESSPCVCNANEIYKQFDYCKGKRRRTFDCVSRKNDSIKLDRSDCDEPIGSYEKDCSKSLSTTRPSTVKDTSNLISRSSSGSSSSSSSNAKHIWQITIVAVSLVTIVFVVVGFFHYRRKQLIPVDIYGNGPEQDLPKVYISHMVSSKKKDESLVLQLALELNRYQIHSYIDILDQLEICNVGGKHIWVPNKVQSSDVVLVMLTESYLEGFHALQENETIEECVDEKLCQMQLELRHANFKLYKSLQRKPQIILVLCGVKEEEIPPGFCGSPHVKYPKRFDNSDDNFLRLWGILTKTEPIQLAIDEA